MPQSISGLSVGLILSAASIASGLEPSATSSPTIPPAVSMPAYVVEGTRFHLYGIKRLNLAVGVVTRLGRLKMVTIDEIYADSPAERAGLRARDRILKINGRDVHAYTHRNFWTLLDDARGEDGHPKFVLEIERRDGSRTSSFTVTLEDAQ